MKLLQNSCCKTAAEKQLLLASPSSTTSATNQGIEQQSQKQVLLEILSCLCSVMIQLIYYTPCNYAD